VNTPGGPGALAAGRVTAIIPARMGSTRFPGKVLASRTGRPLIRHVYDAAKLARSVHEVVVATDDQRVLAAVSEFGGRAVLTRTDHDSGTSRLAEAAGLLGLGPDAIVVNVQGDEPELEPESIDRAVAALRAGDAPMATIAVPFGPGEDAGNPNLVKVVVGLDGSALYFSRALIPHIRDPGAGPFPPPLCHVGLYVYRRGFLDTYTALKPTELERAESLEQLRVLAHGYRIAVAVSQSRGFGGIDTPEQYEAFVERWRSRAR
jgi:3-deoxy-manno-octulosonate cytidylyltransferase (CMP-KDO synthetase)